MTRNDMNENMRKNNAVGRFLAMVRRTDSRRARSDLDFYTYSAMPALLTMQAGLKQEQL